MSTAVYPVFANAVLPATTKQNELLKNIALVFLGSLILTFSSKISLPFYPVPMTMQTLAVLLIGGMYGSRLGAITVLTYLTYGAFGLPVFASGAGIAYMMGPTGGFLVGFVAAAYIVGIGARLGHDRVVSKSLVWFFLGHATIFACGVTWLTVLFGFEKAISVGLYPFIIPAMLKFTMTALILKGLWGFIPENK